MKILFLCQYFPPEPGAPAARTHEHAKEWVRMGHEVTVVCGIPNHPDGEVPLNYRHNFVYEEVLDDIRVLRCWFLVAANAGRVRRSVAFISFMLAALYWSVVKGGRADVVMATSPQLLCGLSGYGVALVKRALFVFEVRDLWPRQIIDLGVLRNPWLIALLRGVERFLYRKASVIITVAEAARRELVQSGVPPEKIHTITNAIALDVFTPQPRLGAMRYRYGWGERNLVMYIGTHGLSQGLETVLAAARELEDREDLHFVFVGSGAERESLIKTAEKDGLKNVEFIPNQPRPDMPEFYAAADICLVPLKQREVFLTNIPSKMFEIMACARPIILGVEGQGREILEAAGAGVAVPPEDPHALAEAIRALADDPEARRRYGENGRRYVEKASNRAEKARELIDIVQRALS
ncbi:MAG TPA: glycosyltransferase family 4 protein [Candidatus Hydrogenedentes bacterium]|nr:glycosyltransferase family 4 protein [Candidatus Hydrogenedentota bacterium]